MVSAWRNFKNIFSRPLFTIIFRPEMLKFHPYSILTGDTMVGFVIFCVLRIYIILLIFWITESFVSNGLTDLSFIAQPLRLKAFSVLSILNFANDTHEKYQNPKNARNYIHILIPESSVMNERTKQNLR